MNDYETLKQFIKKSNYKVKTDIDNLVEICFAHYDGYVESEEKYDKDSNLEYVDDCILFVKENGICEFDYYC